MIGVAGDGRDQLDYRNAVFGNFPLMFAVIAVLTFILLARAFRSVVLARQGVILNLISLGADLRRHDLVLAARPRLSAVFGIPATGAITFWLPLMMFAFLFGLSMDYEVFILTRVREEYDRTGSTDGAIIGVFSPFGGEFGSLGRQPGPDCCLSGARPVGSSARSACIWAGARGAWSAAGRA